jgi:hypothetical protein
VGVGETEAAMEDHGDMTVTLCRELCRGRGRAYSAVTGGGASCHCFRDDAVLPPPDSARLPYGSCDGPCVGNVRQNCGGSVGGGGGGAWAVYRTDDVNPRATGCGDLYLHDLHTTATYQLDTGEYVTCGFTGIYLFIYPFISEY